MFVEHKEQGEVTEAPATLDDASTLLKGALIIEKYGHHKGWLYKKDPVKGPACLLGAILRAMTGTSENWDHKHQKHSEVCRIAQLVHPRMAAWNDEPERTQAEVVSKMRAVALTL